MKMTKITVSIAEILKSDIEELRRKKNHYNKRCDFLKERIKENKTLLALGVNKMEWSQTAYKAYMLNKKPKTRTYRTTHDPRINTKKLTLNSEAWTYGFYELDRQDQEHYFKMEGDL